MSDLQESLNDAYDGGRFDVAVKYGAMLNLACICMLYGGGLPLLYPIAAAGFGLAFLIDRALRKCDHT